MKTYAAMKAKMKRFMSFDIVESEWSRMAARLSSTGSRSSRNIASRPGYSRVNRADDRARNRELDHGPRDPAPKDLRGQRLDRERDQICPCVHQAHQNAQRRAGEYAAGWNKPDTKHGEEKRHDDMDQNQQWK